MSTNPKYAVMPYGDYKDACDKIREKTGKSDMIKSGDMASEIERIQNVPSDEPVIEPLEVTENGTYEAPDGVDGYSPITVNVAGSGGSDDGSFKAFIERTATNLTLPSDLTRIGGYAFYGCTKLESIELPDNIEIIGGYAFGYCKKLTRFEVPSSVTTIAAAAFTGCTGLTEFTFKNKVTGLGPSTFENCTNLLTINVPWAEGEVANAPWGATNATINYNYTPDQYPAGWEVVTE